MRVLRANTPKEASAAWAACVASLPRLAARWMVGRGGGGGRGDGGGEGLMGGWAGGWSPLWVRAQGRV